MSVSHWPETPTELKAADAPTGSLWRFTVDQYHQMLRAGILTEDDPVELLEGWLVAKMTKNPAHRAATRLLRTALEGILISGWYVDSQEPVTLHDSEPEPDVAVVRGQPRDYLDRHPGASDLALAVEIAEASLERDRGSKLRVYARARIPAYWIVNLIERRIEVYSDPLSKAVPASYGRRSDFGEADSVPVVVEGTEIGRIAVRDVLP